MLSPAVQLQKQLDAAPPPPKKRQKPKRKQNKIQPLYNLSFCCDKRCENEQWNITDTKMLSTTIALYFNKST